ncbi:nickel/cobalt efflux transporter [Undibacterium terreum]|uniref:Nickel/cobalt efflux system n=1 Tax=Undibacterium terreum TaxID=1224302 RepID=A0A916UDP4_9BURK|nr:nickel/cobalt efflux transporter [Undibacterium terreum]GGC69186.1 nickel/cobalt efflux system [Undibacterium terreum]
MPPISDLILQGSTNLWLFIPTAILLGALHGLEPGHSKTMMASFIIAVRGTIAQAVILGLCAALSHSLIVWALAAFALKFGNQLIAEQAEPYIMLLSGSIVIAVALWMLWRTRQDELAAKAHQHALHGGQVISTGHGMLELLIFEDGVPPVFRLYAYDEHERPIPFSQEQEITLKTQRPDGSENSFTMVPHKDYLQSSESIPEPHEFKVLLSVSHGTHAHHFDIEFSEHDHGHAHHGHDHGHSHAHEHGGSAGYQDAHERAHAEEIKQRFNGQQVTTGQIALFGLTGGLMPCPASVTILMICLQLKKFTLGIAMVASFSLGLALSLVSVGVIAAWGAQQIGKKLGNLSTIARKLPYLSSVLMVVVGLVMCVQGYAHIPA